MYIDIIQVPVIITDILGPFTPPFIGCGLGLVLILIFYIIIILFKLNFNCIYIPVGLLIIVIFCMILNIVGVVELPDWVEDTVPELPDDVLPDSPPGKVSPSKKCCSNVDFNKIYYDNGRLYLTIVCRDGDFKDQCVEGTVYDGLGNFWTDVSCCTGSGSNANKMDCEGLDYITAKTVKAQIKIKYKDTDGRTCEIDDIFPLPSIPAPPPDTTTDDESTDDESPPSSDSCDETDYVMCGGVCCYYIDCVDGVCQ
jgi:hypothetical protein